MCDLNKEPTTSTCAWSSASSRDSFIDQLLIEFECPVCIQYMHPPIRQCTVGHSFCDDCFKKLKTCPTCRLVLSTSSRSYVLEKLHSKLTFPCKYLDQGCKERISGEAIQRHEFQCCFGGNACPLKIINDCPWYGRGNAILEHCKEHHRNNYFCTNIQRLTCTNFIRETAVASAAFYMVFFAFGEVFKCVWEVNYVTGYMRWCVFRIITEKRDTNNIFDFIIDIQNQNGCGHKLAVKGVCPTLEQGVESGFNNNQFVFTHYDMVRDFCKDNDLIYMVKIVQRIVDFASSEE